MLSTCARFLRRSANVVLVSCVTYACFACLLPHGEVFYVAAGLLCSLMSPLVYLTEVAPWQAEESGWKMMAILMSATVVWPGLIVLVIWMAASRDPDAINYEINY